MIENWRKPRNQEFYNLCSSPDIVTVIKSGSMGWSRCIKQLGEMQNAYEILDGKSERG
jgi:hypothetical protein